MSNYVNKYGGKTVMDVKILGEYGFDEAMLAIAMNKKKYDRDMYPVSVKLSTAGPGHDKFLEFLHVYIDYTTTRSIHQQIDTYRVGVTKSSESTHHMLIEDVLETSIDRNFIKEEFKRNGFSINTTRCIDGLPPINKTALLITKINKIDGSLPLCSINDDDNFNQIEQDIKRGEADLEIYDLITEYVKTYLVTDNNEKISDGIVKVLKDILLRSFKIDYDKYYSMFEGGSEAITKETVDIMVDLAMSMDEDRYGKLHKLKRMLPEGFLQRRIMSLNYKALKNILGQRLLDGFDGWRMFCREIIMQVKHPEYFQDIFDKYHTSKEEIANNMLNGQKYIQGL